MPRKMTVAASRRTFPIVGVGASAGGLEAFRSLLQSLPAHTGMAFVLVQHLDPEHESLLTKLLARATRMPVTEVTEGVAVEPDHVYVIPPNTAMGIRKGILHLRKRQDRGHMPIDHFFRSLAESEGSRAIGVILSGVASDGTLGLTAIKAAGGITFAQDAKSAKYDGMPRSAIAAGCVDFVLSPQGIARELKRMSLHPYLAMPDRPAAGKGQRGEDLLEIFALLRNATDVDFTNYKRSTIHRRIARRMALHKISSLRQYIRRLQENRAELGALYEDILIHATGFFREPDTFRALKETILPRVFRNKEPGEPLRVWVAGCSTGEEVYSVAITLLEYLRDQTRDHASSVPIQIFGTDINETALDKARAGIYSESAVLGISPERMRRFFVRADAGYQITKPVRQMCIFARQDLAKDPPYSRLDLLTCRNVLIHMEPVLQKRVMTIFHYALKPGGFLVLGKSESSSGFPELFTPVGRNRKIYSRKFSNHRPGFDLPAAHPKYVPPETSAIPDTPARFDFRKEADRIVLNHYAPAGLVASEDLQILHFRGNIAPYLSPSPGRASFSLLRMVRPEFAVELRTAIHRAGKQEIPIRKEGLRIKRGGHLNEVSLEVVPFKGQAGEWFFLVLFTETQVPDPGPGASASHAQASRAHEKELARLRRELQTTKEYLQSILEEHESTDEELKSASEEALSSNEELQSTNEELQTAQEELQSTNEELSTLNEQLQNRNQQLSQLSDDWSNLLHGLNIPVVMLGRDRRIRRFTPPAEKLLNLLPTDIGRPIHHIRPSVQVPDLDGLITEVMEKVSQKDLEIQDRDGRWYSMRVRPYRTADNRIDGVLMILIDIHALKTSEAALRQSQTQLQALAAGLLTAQEEERARVARELHDDISQKLATLHLEAESVLRKEPEPPGKLRSEMTRLLHRLRGILRDVERTAYRLHPSSLDHLGLSLALKSYCADFGKQNGITTRCTERNLPRAIPPRLGLTIYRVVQEALRNVVKHSGARRANVSVAGKNGSIILTVKDFGRGFDATRPPQRGLGLISMEERVRQAGGAFTVKTTPGEGVRIDVLIPLPPQQTSGKALESSNLL